MLAPTLMFSPEVDLADIESRAERLHEEERLVQLDLGRAVLEGRPGISEHSALERIRRELTGLYAAIQAIDQGTHQ